MRRLLFRRGYTDKLYYYNFITVNLIVAAVILVTALGGVLGITEMDMSAMANIPQWAYAELGLHTALIVWKAKTENCRKNKDINMEDMEENDS